jgi:hypothetical protein
MRWACSLLLAASAYALEPLRACPLAQHQYGATPVYCRMSFTTHLPLDTLVHADGQPPAQPDMCTVPS